MIHTEYRYEIRTRDGLLVVRLFGEIDHHNAVALREELDALVIDKRPARLVLDLANVDFMDSAGLGLIMGRLRLVKDLGGVMVLAAPNPRVGKILTLAGMERFLEITNAAKGERA